MFDNQIGKIATYRAPETTDSDSDKEVPFFFEDDNGYWVNTPTGVEALDWSDRKKQYYRINRPGEPWFTEEEFTYAKAHPRTSAPVQQIEAPPPTPLIAAAPAEEEEEAPLEADVSIEAPFVDAEEAPEQEVPVELPAIEEEPIVPEPIRTPTPTPPPRTPTPPPIMAAAPDLTALLNALAQMTTNMTNLTNAIANQNPPPAVNANVTATIARAITEKPPIFKGKDSVEARRFRIAFQHYAANTAHLCDIDPATNNYVRNNARWIASALSFFQDDAATWALPEMEKLETAVAGQPATFPFANDWADFMKQYKARFETTNEVHDAKEALKRLKQTTTVANYTQEFKGLQSRTGWSVDDLRDRYYDGLIREHSVSWIRTIIRMLCTYKRTL